VHSSDGGHSQPTNNIMSLGELGKSFSFSFVLLLLLFKLKKVNQQTIALLNVSLEQVLRANTG